jgi:phosphate transport system substrate-binding protein
MSAFVAALLVLAALSDYHPGRRVSGTIRFSGDDQMAAVLRLWEKGFRRYHPDVRFERWLKGTASGIYGLEMRTADVALMGRAMNPFEYYGTYERSWVFPVQVQIATGSFAAPDKSPAYAVFVHRDNPVAKLTVRQLDGIFGAQRGGGWNGLSWDQGAARGAEQDLRTWGQLGAGGTWADRGIHVYGPPLAGAGAITDFQSRVLHGADLWNEDLREYADPARMIADLSKDPAGIAYGPLASATPDVKALPLAETAAGPYVELTRDTVADRSYPLSRPVYAVFNLDDEKSEIVGADPKVRELLRYVLSKQGQAGVAHEGSYLPLTAVVAAGQLEKLDSTATPPERRVIQHPIKVRMSIDEDPIVVRLARSLGYLEQEGIELERVDVEKITGEDYLVQQPLAKGQIDAAYCWFNHAIYGARHGFPVQAVMLFNDAPGMKVLVANRLRGRIASAADFGGRNVAAGAGYGMKSVLTRYLAKKAGAGTYASVMMEKAGREEAVVRGLKEGKVDVMTFQEPILSTLLGTSLATTLYDLNSGESTARALGARFPAQALLMSPATIAEHPDVAQRLVNALVQAMRFVNSHSAEEIAAALPPDYFAGKDPQAELELIRASLPTYARGDYSISPEEARLAVEVNLSAVFDESEEGRWRATGDVSRLRAEDLYTNRFVRRALALSGGR